MSIYEFVLFVIPQHLSCRMSDASVGEPAEEPRVFVLGDSISIHYGLYLKLALAERGWG